MEKLQILFPVQNSCGILLPKLLSKGVPLEKTNQNVRHVESSACLYCWKKGAGECLNCMEMLLWEDG